ncbi:MAG: class I SAM-dependent methyltransferase [Candidatus Limnocylindrales bacterium]
MNPLIERYDAGAAEYARYWAPVLEQTAERLIDEVDAVVRGDRLRVVDVGSGTGTLALAALRRWRRAEVTATDAAAGMLDFARARAEEAGLTADGRLAFAAGAADELPVATGSFDVAVSSFVLQLVPDRLAALAEIRRVLRPTGLLAYVTWLDRDSREPFRAAEEFDEAVYDLEIDEPEEPDQSIAGDVRSARAAADELRRAGFIRASAREETLVFDWTMESYLDYKLAYDERALLSRLNDEQRRELERNVRARLSRLVPSDFRWHAPVVFARAFAPG